VSRKLNIYPATTNLAELELDSGLYEVKFQYRYGLEAQIYNAAIQSRLGQWYEYDGHYFKPLSITIDKINRLVIITGEVSGTPWAAILIILGVVLAGVIVYLETREINRIVENNPGVKATLNIFAWLVPVGLIIAAIIFIPKLLRGK